VEDDRVRCLVSIDSKGYDETETGRVARLDEYPGAAQALAANEPFVFTDLRMPAMDGVELAKSAKHMRPDVDVVIITGYATVETAVECMKFGAMDYVQKPFTEDELRAFVRKTLIKRQDQIAKRLLPKVRITQGGESGSMLMGEFFIPGGVWISQGHCWASLLENGTARVGLDDFAKKLIGRVDAYEMPSLDAVLRAGQPLFAVRQGARIALAQGVAWLKAQSTNDAEGWIAGPSRTAKLIGTTASVICRLEDADYEGHSLGMLRRIGAALNQRVEIRFVPIQRSA